MLNSIRGRRCIQAITAHQSTARILQPGYFNFEISNLWNQTPIAVSRETGPPSDCQNGGNRMAIAQAAIAKPENNTNIPAFP
jgi:hypothetical protein